jgi:hypothetical protein
MGEPAHANVREALVQRGLTASADAPNDESIKRLLFEVISFAAYVVMGQEVPKWLRRKSPLGDEEPDVEWIPGPGPIDLNRARRGSTEAARPWDRPTEGSRIWAATEETGGGAGSTR